MRGRRQREGASPLVQPLWRPDRFGLFGHHQDGALHQQGVLQASGIGSACSRHRARLQLNSKQVAWPSAPCFEASATVQGISTAYGDPSSQLLRQSPGPHVCQNPGHQTWLTLHSGKLDVGHPLQLACCLVVQQGHALDGTASAPHQREAREQQAKEGSIEQHQAATQHAHDGSWQRECGGFSSSSCTAWSLMYLS